MLKKITPVLMVRSINIIRGGVTKAVMKKANLLAEKHKDVLICTFLYQRTHKEIVRNLHKSKLLAKNVKVINFFEDMKPNKITSNKFRNKNAQHIKEKGFTEIRTKNTNGPSYRYFKNGIYIKYKRFDEDHNLIFIDYFDSNRYRVKREEYDETGFISRIRHMDFKQNKPSLDRYFDYHGHCYLSVRVNPETNEESLTAQYTSQNHEYTTLRSCQSVWFNNVLNDIKHPIVASELRGMDSFLLDVKHNCIKKIAVNHTNHLKHPYDDIHRIKRGCDLLYKNAHHFDQIVFLTEEQKNDVESIYGTHGNFTIIPHSYKQIQQSQGMKYKFNYNPKSAVTLARYHEDKRLNESIEAFRYVVDQIPEAQYHIYGYGPMEKDLKDLIKQLKLEKNVFLKEYTLNPKRVYESAACSILTSRQEGFAMVITESMSVGTPVVSYNIKYGPSDIIDDGINGYLVTNRDKEQLAEKVINIMQDTQLREQLSKRAYAVKKKYSEEKYRQKWLNLFES